MEVRSMGPVIVYGKQACADCVAAKRVLDSRGVEYEVVDVEADPRAMDRMVKLNHGDRRVPTIVFPSGRLLVEPSPQLLVAVLEKELTPA